MLRDMLTAHSLRDIRRFCNLSQMELAGKSGVSATAIAEFETGKRDLRASSILKLCEALDVAVIYRVKGAEIPGP